MAVTIIKGGKNEFVGHCKWCGCDFRYTTEDVLKTIDKVECPQAGCKRQLNHHGETGTSAWHGTPNYDGMGALGAANAVQVK